MTKYRPIINLPTQLWSWIDHYYCKSMIDTLGHYTYKLVHRRKMGACVNFPIQHTPYYITNIVFIIACRLYSEPLFLGDVTKTS